VHSESSAALTILMAIAGVASAGQSGNATSGMDKLNQEHAVFFSGKVVLADGSAPAEAVLIQRVCDGHTHNEGATDSTGQFSFKVESGSSNAGAGVADATQSGGPPPDITKPFGNSTQYSNPVTTMLRNCEVHAVLAGYRTESVRIETQSMHDGVHLPDIILHPITRGDMLAVSVTTLHVPPAAIKAYGKGVEAERQQKWEAAASAYAKAAKSYPQYADAWFRLGLMRQKQNDPEGAADAWKQARRADPKFVKPLEALTRLADAKGDWTASERYSAQWIELDPEDFPAAYLFHAIAQARLSKMADAEKDARSALKLDKNHTLPRISYVLGLILLNKQEYAESAECFRNYLTLAPGAHDAAVVKNELNRIEQMAAASPHH
jgi:tetratricopeptide (TPR) repeat protein